MEVLGEKRDARGHMPPYASTAAIEQFIERVRNRNAPSRVDQGLLQDFGIPAGAVAPLLSALRWLGLINEVGEPTEVFRSIQTPLEEELSSSLRAIFERQYSEALARLDLKTDTRDHIKAYFGRNYSVALANKMTTCFLYLASKAGLEPAVAPRQARDGGPSKQRPRPQISRKRERIQKEPVTAQETTSGYQAPLGDRGKVGSIAEFWRTYIENLGLIQVSIDNPRDASAILREKNQLIETALEKLAEIEESRPTQNLGVETSQDVVH